MQRTDRGRLLLGVGSAAFLLALATGTPVPAMVGAMLVILVAGARAETAAVDIAREVPSTANEDDAFDAVLQATLPGHVSMREGPIVGDPEVESSTTSLHGVTTSIRPRRVGALAFTRVDLEAHDRHKLTLVNWSMPLPDNVRVRPSSAMLALGRRVGRKARIKRRPRRSFSAEPEPEVERLRDHQPGDLLRDIDWKASSRRTDLVSREWIRAPQTTVTILLDAGASMREGQVVPKMRTAVNAAIATLSAATSAGLPTGLVAWSEDGLEATARPGATKTSVRIALEHLAHLSANPRRPAVMGVPLDAPHLDAHERAFLQAAGHGRGGTTPLEAALAHVTRTQRQPGWIVCIIDAEERPGLTPLLLKRLQARGHRVTILAPKNGPHHYRLAETTSDDHEQLARWLHERAVATNAARRHKARFVALGPAMSQPDLQEVMSFA